MLGAIIGDIAGSRFEWKNKKSKDFELLSHLKGCKLTDDSVMTLAVAKAILDSNATLGHLDYYVTDRMRKFGRHYPNAGYGKGFKAWLTASDPKPYGSIGNGAAMRVSPCGFAAHSLDNAERLARVVTDVTHNSPEGEKAAEAVASAIFFAREGKSIVEIRDYVTEKYYKIDFTLDSIRAGYTFDVSCEGSVPQAFEAFFESTGFEDAIRNAISIGGDSDTIAAITGSIAEAYYGIPADIRNLALTFLDSYQLKTLNEFEAIYGIYLSKDTDDDIGRKVSLIPEYGEQAEDRQMNMFSALAATETAEHLGEAEDEKVSAQKLFSFIYKACDIIRGPIDQDDYKSYILPLLFYKRLSDVYDEETKAAEQKYGDDIVYFPEEELHSFSIPEGLHWSDIRIVSEDVGKAIVDAMMGIEKANPDTLAGLFSSFDEAEWENKTNLSDERLKDLIEHMSSLNVGNNNYSADVMGDAYEFLLKKFADISKKNAGEFYTPRTIVKLLVMLMNPKSGESVYDPACGTGGMLIEALRNMDDVKASYGKICGQEKNNTTSAIARMNLFLHGAKEFDIQQDDTLNNPSFIYHGSLRKFDCVLANPPFGLKKWGAKAFEKDVWHRNIWGTPSNSNADYAWLQHMMCSMNEKTGRCAVVMPQGVLFHGGVEGKMRQKMIEEDKLECVITLVGNVFYGAGVSACLLYFNNNKSEAHKGKVCLIDASKIYTPMRAKNVMTEENIQEVFRLWTGYSDVIDRCKIVSIEDLASHDYSLSVNTYIEKTPAPPVDTKAVKAAFYEALYEVKESEENLMKLLKEGGYIDV